MVQMAHSDRGGGRTGSRWFTSKVAIEKSMTIGPAVCKSERAQQKEKKL